MRKFLLATALLCQSAFGVAAADNPVVLELYTSQGCSSCPPADALLAQLADRDDVIPLALHVDYWDYIGWKDAFADPAYSRRQKAYARKMSWRVYTPQMVISGAQAVVGSRAMDVVDSIRRQEAQPAKVDLSVSRSGNKLSINATRLLSGTGPFDVFVVRYLPSATVPIRAGENAGRKLLYSHIVTDWQKAGSWNGRSALSKTITLDGDEPVVVIVQEKSYGPIVAAARLR